MSLRNHKKFILISFFGVLFFLAIIIFVSHPPKENLISNSERTFICPKPLVIQSPVDLEKVTSILYPGQVRGGDYKPHGGFRFDNASSNQVEVRAPLVGTLTAASRYIEAGEVQYLLDFETSCGIKYRFDHLLVLAPKIADAVSDLPEAKENDSRTTRLKKEINVSEDEPVATSIGMKNNKNVFVDLGVYKSGGLFSNPRSNPICWFDLLSPEQKAKVKSLPPADSTSGSQSDLCTN